MATVFTLVELAEECRVIIHRAETDGLVIDEGNVVDLCADQVQASLSDIRCALVVAGLADRFPNATRARRRSLCRKCGSALTDAEYPDGICGECES